MSAALPVTGLEDLARHYLSRDRACQAVTAEIMPDGRRRTCGRSAVAEILADCTRGHEAAAFVCADDLALTERGDVVCGCQATVRVVAAFPLGGAR